MNCGVYPAAQAGDSSSWVYWSLTALAGSSLSSVEYTTLPTWVCATLTPNNQPQAGHRETKFGT